MVPSKVRGNGLFYGWFVLAASFFVLFVSVGARNVRHTQKPPAVTSIENFGGASPYNGVSNNIVTCYSLVSTV